MYFVALVPPEPLRDQLTDLKSYFKEKYDSSKALNSPPHITLHMPFKWKEEKENRLAEVLGSFCQTAGSFNLLLNGFGAFAPRVIFIEPAENQALREMQKNLTKAMRLGLNIYNAEYKNRGFHPHLTLAFRDLKKQQFVEAWEEFQGRSFEADFTVSNISLLKHNGKLWEIFRDFPFGKATVS